MKWTLRVPIGHSLAEQGRTPRRNLRLSVITARYHTLAGAARDAPSGIRRRLRHLRQPTTLSSGNSEGRPGIIRTESSGDFG